MNRAHARAELDRFLGITDDDDVFVEQPPPKLRDFVWNGTLCPPRPTFFDQAACKDVPTQSFFAFGRQGRREIPSDEMQEALDACARCPVKIECRAYGREHRLHGIWGGETELERATVGRAPALSTGDVIRAQRAAEKRRRAAQ